MLNFSFHNKKVVILLAVLCLFSETLSSQEADSSKNASLIIKLKLNEIPTVYKALERYAIISDFTKNSPANKINQTAFNYLSEINIPDLDFTENYEALKNNTSYAITNANDLQLFYAIWRKKLINIEHDSQLPEIMNYGLEHLISEGYTDLSGDVFPFVTMLMDEHHKYHYDHTRTKAFGEGARGTYTVTETFSIFKVPDKTQTVGVCRDIHDTGLRMIRELSTNYYSKLYPELKINTDDYIFLTSWVTQSSQHITISYIDPLNPKTVYELDWGRLIKKTDNYGYEHGRNYGNVFRVWQFNENKGISVPIDYKNTMIGNILDEQYYNTDEAEAFLGIKNVEPYSALELKKPIGKQMKWQLSLGNLALEQGYFLTGISHRSKKLNIGKKISFQGSAALQAMFLQETEKKNVMFPINTYVSSHALMGFPRYTASFKLFESKIFDRLESHFYFHNRIEVFFLTNRSVRDTDEKPYKINTSGDGGIYSTQGYSVRYVAKQFSSELKLQNRSFLIPKDVRLMSPNPFEVLGNARIVSPARDLILNINFSTGKWLSITGKTIFEFTNMGNTLFHGQFEIDTKIKQVASLHLGAQSYYNISGVHYFWYPVNRNLFFFGISSPNQKAKAIFFLRTINDEYTKGINLQYKF
jgi:hypothetical protein